MTRGSRLGQAVAAAVCLLFVATLRDARAPLVRPPRVELSDSDDALQNRRAKVELAVADSAGHPLGGASVRVLFIHERRAFLAGAAMTDALGRAVVDRLPIGEVWILAEAPGFGRASTQAVLIEGARELALSLARAEVLRVAVVDDGGAPIARASIDVRSSDPLPYVARTDDSGGATLARLGPTPWIVKASADGFEAAVANVTTVPTGTLTLSLKRLGALLVDTVDEDGRAIAGATVAIVGSGMWPARKTLSDARGRATIAAVPKGIYDLRATRGALVSATNIGVSLGRGETKSLTLMMSPGRRAVLRVVDGEGDDAKPVAGANVVVAEGGLSSFPFEAVTDASGGATLGPLALGEAYVSVSAVGFVPRTGVLLPPPAQGALRIALSRGATVLGEVVDARGFPIGGATIEAVGTTDTGEPIDDSSDRQAFRAAHFAWALTGPRELRPAGELGVMPGPVPPIPHASGAAPGAAAGARSAGAEPWVTRADGTFRAFPVTPGRVRLIVRHAAYVEGTSELVRLTPAGEASVRLVLLAGGSLEGRVVDEHGGPVAGARVDMAAVRGSLERTSVTASDGTFAFASVPAEVVLSLARPQAAERVALRTTLAVKEGERKEIELVLPAARESVTVRVLDDRGDPLDAVEVRLVSLAPDAPAQRTLFTSRAGDVVFDDVRGLPVRISAALRGHAPVVLTSTAAPAELRATLPLGIEVTGAVTTRGGREALEGAEVTLKASASEARARTDKEGNYRLRDVAAGEARLSVQRDGFAPFERAQRIESSARPDRPVELAPVDLTEGGSVTGDVVDERGEAVPGARVARGVAPPLLPSGKPPRGVALTNRQGEFTLGELPEGEVTLEAYAPDKGRGRITVTVAAGRTTDRARIVLTPPNGALAGAGAPGERGGSPAAGGVAVALSPGGDARGLPQVTAVVARSEADRAGLSVGDRIAAIDGRAVSTVEQARERLAGALSDDVIVDVVRGSERLQLRIARERVSE